MGCVETLRTGAGKRAAGTLLRQHHAGRLELVVIAAVLLIKFCSGLQNVPFHPDESQWIATSYAFQAWIGGDFSAPVWHDSYWTRTQPPLTRYLIAVGWLAGGYNFHDLNTPWIWGFDEATNLARGALPSPGVLWWSRLPMAILAAVSALALFVLVTESAGRLAGYILVILFAYNHFFLYALRRAMSETPLLVCLTLAMLAGCSAATSWQQLRRNAHGLLRSFIQPLLRFGLMGFLCGAATAAKLNGALAVLSGLALVALLAATRTANLSRVFRVAVVGCSAIVITASAAGTFVACNPYLYPNVPARSMAMLRQRFEEMAKQQGFAPSQVIRGAEAHALEILRSVFEDLATVSFTGSWLLNLPLCIVGFGYFVAAGWHWLRNSAGSAAAAVTVLTALICAMPALLTPLAWDRYFLLPVVFSTMFIAVGLSAVLNAAARRGLPRLPDSGPGAPVSVV